MEKLSVFRLYLSVVQNKQSIKDAHEAEQMLLNTVFTLKKKKTNIFEYSLIYSNNFLEHSNVIISVYSNTRIANTFQKYFSQDGLRP